jgi:branched-chain amino acid transport system permease protein
MALGLTIVYGVTHIFNFGHGIVAVSGGYFTWLCMSHFGLGLFPAIAVSVAVMFVIGLILYHATLSPLLKTKDWEFSIIIFLLGLGILWENLLLQGFGPRVKDIPRFLDGRFKMGFVRINYHEIALIVIVILFVVALNYFIKKTWFGQAMRAVAQDMDGARIVGINLQKTFGLAFATGNGGDRVFRRPAGNQVLHDAAHRLGLDGQGVCDRRLRRAGQCDRRDLAAFILGLAEAVISLYLGPMWVWPIWFFMFLIILLIRPQGLMGGRTL